MDGNYIPTGNKYLDGRPEMVTQYTMPKVPTNKYSKDKYAVNDYITNSLPTGDGKYNTQSGNYLDFDAGKMLNGAGEIGSLAMSPAVGLYDGISNGMGWMKDNPGTSMIGLGSMMNGVGGLYSAMLAKDYYGETTDLMNQQMGLYEDEINRRNDTRSSYGSAFSGGA